MEASQGAKTFVVSPQLYNSFMGRFSQPLGPIFLASLPVGRGDRVLDLGCGPGALTGPLVELLGAESVTVVDPSPPFLEECVRAHPGVSGTVARAEALPFPDRQFDAVLSELVLHFIGDLDQAGKEMVRVTRPGGLIAACTWDVDTMEMLSYFLQAAKTIAPDASQADTAERYSGEGTISAYFASIGLDDSTETTLTVESEFADFDELWRGYENGIGYAGLWLVKQTDDTKRAVRAELYRNLNEPTGAFTLSATARSAHGRTPA